MHTDEDMHNPIMLEASARIAYLDAQSALKFREAELTTQGLDGKNAEGRAANLRLALRTEHEDVAAAERALIWARAYAEVDRMKFQLELKEEA